MEVVLAIFRPGAERFSYAVTNDVTVIGRQEDCDLRAPILEVSRKHCRLIKDDNTLELEDLGSSNGTYLNGLRVSDSLLKAGDVIQIGPVRLVVQINGSPPDDEIVAGIDEPAEPNAETGGFALADDEKTADEEAEDDLIDFNPEEPSANNS